MNIEAINRYIDELYDNQNRGAAKEQQGLFTKKQYYELIKPVMEAFEHNPNASLKEIRHLLYEQSGIEANIKSLVYDKMMTPGVVVTYGTPYYRDTIVAGNQREVIMGADGNLIKAPLKMTTNTIFDLASVTKLFTSLSLFKLVQDGMIKLDEPITKYAKEFKNLGDVTIFDLMTFSVPLKTEGRLDKAINKEAAEQLLFNIKVDSESDNKDPYTDMGAMVLGYVIEHVAGMNYYDYLNQNILHPLKMDNTLVQIPSSKLEHIASTNFSGSLYKDGNYVLKKDVLDGHVNDPKAFIMGQTEGHLSGHAGLFSTIDDMSKLNQALIKGEVIKPELLKIMTKNYTGRPYVAEDGLQKYVQYLGALVYSKNPIQGNSTIYHALSGNSFSTNGFTGTADAIDLTNQIYMTSLANRTHNRLIFIDKTQTDKMVTGSNGERSFTLPNGSTQIDASRWAWVRDDDINFPLAQLALQNLMAEKFYGMRNAKEASTMDETVKII